MNKGAGILFLSKKGTALFLKRGPDAPDFPLYWDFPGGGREGDESAEDCALREATEEIGSVPDGNLQFHTRTAGSAPKGVAGVGVPAVSLPVDGSGTPKATSPEPNALPMVDFATFLQRVDEEFIPELNSEHDAYAWAPTDMPPQPLHPGCAIAVDRLGMNELGVARAISDGRLTSPQRYENVWLFALRITGTEVAYRTKGNEFVVRDPALYLNDEFLARCNGLPVIWKHPRSRLLDGDEFVSRIVGTVFLPYIAGTEVWAIAKIFVDEVAQMMSEGGLSTSPGVNFADWSVNRELMLKMVDGSKEKVLVEGDPSLLDHVAICLLGVWDKGDEPTGIRSEAREDSAMADEDDKSKDDAHKDDAHKDDSRKDAKKDDARKDEGGEDKEKGEEKDKSKDDAHKDDDARKDGMTEMMDAIKSVADAVGSLGKRMDAYEAERGDARKDAKKDDDEDEGEAERAAADRKDAKKDDAKKDDARKDDAKKDAKKDDSRKDGTRHDSRIDSLDRQISEMRKMIPQDRSDADYDAMLDAQARADDVFVEFGDRAPRPLRGQDVMAYDRHVAKKLQEFSPTWKGKDLKAITDEAFPIIRDQIFAEAKVAAANPINVRPDELRMVERKQDGHIVRNFHGQPGAWMNRFAGPVQLRAKGQWSHERDGLGSRN